MKPLNRLFTVLLVILTIATSRAAVTTRSFPVNRSSSISITNAQHGVGSKSIAVRVYDSAGVLKSTGDYSYSINPTTFAVTVNFSGQFTGSVQTLGPILQYTMNSTDFEPSVYFGASGYLDTLQICNACTATNPAARKYDSRAYAMAGKVTYVHGNGPATIRAYILDNAVVFGLTAANSSVASGACGNNAANCKVMYNIGTFPSGSIPLGTVTTTTVGTRNVLLPSSLSDNRPMAFR